MAYGSSCYQHLLLLLTLAASLQFAAAPAARAPTAIWEAASSGVSDLDDNVAAEGEEGGANVDDPAIEAKTVTEDVGDAGDDRRHQLTELRELLHRDLRRRRFDDRGDRPDSYGKREATLGDIVGAAVRVGDAVDKEAKAAGMAAEATALPVEAVTAVTAMLLNLTTSPVGNWTAPTNIFVAFWLKLRKLLPLPALIACFAAGGLVLLLIFILIIYCCCCRTRGGLNRKGGPPQTILYKDLDLFGTNRPPYGTINYSLEYDLKKDNLLVTVSNCQDLRKGLDSMDPYVVVSVMSEKDEARGLTRGTKPKTSKVVRNTSNPVFNFACVFPVKRKSELKEKILVFEVYDWDYGIKHDMVARKVLHLRRMGEGLDDILGRNADFSKPLKKGLARDERGPGDICLSLYYAAKDMSLTVSIVECKGVFVSKRKEEPDLETLPNTFVQLSLRQPQSKREQIKRSKIVPASRNPYFNQQFVFDIGSAERLRTSVLRVSLIHLTDTLRIKRPVGSLELHSEADPDSLPLLHWTELLQTPNRATARWHNLITPEAEERNRKVREKEEKRRLQEMREEAEAAEAAREAEAKT